MIQPRLTNLCIFQALLPAILLFSCSCTCKNPPQTTSTNNPEIIPSFQPTGIWHTGTHQENDVVQPTAPSVSQVPDLYHTTYDMYRVEHVGSCGYRSFLPILLDEILVDKKWEPWLENLRTTIYEPAKRIIETVDLKSTKYMSVSPTDDPDKLLQDTKKLLEKLDAEPIARKLEEAEIQLLVKFMRQIFLMTGMIKAQHVINEKDPNTRLDQAALVSYLFDIFLRKKYKGTEKFWADARDFLIFNIPFVLLSDPSSPKMGGKRFIISYHTPPDCMYPDLPAFANDPDWKISLHRKPNIIIYQHGGGALFDYLLPKQKN